MSARERMRRYRERLRSGVRLIPLEVDDLKLGEMLAATGDIDPRQDDDREKLKEGLESLLERLHRAVTRNSTGAEQCLHLKYGDRNTAGGVCRDAD
jgi:hypothetical protein